MAKVNQSSMKQWADGQTMHGPDYNQERDLMIAAYNDSQDQINELKGAGGVGTNQIQDNAVTTPKINNLAVTAAKLAVDSVTNTKLADLSVTGNKIQNSTITNANLSNNIVTAEKLVDGSVTTDKLAPGAVTLLKMGSNSVNTAALLNGSVITSKLADDAVDTVKILDGAVSGDKITNGAITPEKLSQVYYTATQTDQQINAAISGGLPQDVVDQIIASIGDIGSDTVNVLANDAYSPSTPPSSIDAGVYVFGITDTLRQIWNDSTYFGFDDVVPILVRTSKSGSSVVEEIFYQGPGWNAVYKRVSMSASTWTGWRDEETTFGAQAKADAAKTAANAHAEEVVLPQANANAQNYVNGKTWQKFPLTQNNGVVKSLPQSSDLNTLLTAGQYDVLAPTNGPLGSVGGIWFYIEVFIHSNGTGDFAFQRATRLEVQGPTLYVRNRAGGVWSAWSPDVFQSGVDAKNGIVGAINAKGGSASTSDTWAQLAAKINAIQQGQYQRVDIAANQYVGSLNINGASLGVHGPVFANIPAGTRVVSLQGLSMAGMRAVAAFSNFKVAFVLADIDGRLWSISAPSEVGGDRDSKLHSAQIDIFAGISKSQSLSSSLTYQNYQSVKPSGFRSDSPMQIRLGVVQIFNETKAVDFAVGGLTVLSM